MTPREAPDYQALARELVRAVRGRRSQAWLSRRMGFTSNVLYRWEAGLREPSIAQVVALAGAVGIDVRAAMIAFDRRLAARLSRPIRGEQLAAALIATVWHQSLAALARRAGLPAAKVARVARGESDLRLSELLFLLDVTCGRMIDWIAELADPRALPSAREAWEALESAREAAAVSPLAEGALALLETRAYREHDDHPRGYLAERLDVSQEVEDETLALLERVGWVRREGTYRVAPSRDVDTRRVGDGAFAALKERWVTESGRRLTRRDGRAVASYVVFSASHRQLERAMAILRDAHDEVREVLREPDPETDRAAVVTITISALDGDALPVAAYGARRARSSGRRRRR